MNMPAGGKSDEDPNAPIANFSQCHVGIVEHLKVLGELPALLGPAARARKIATQTLAFFDEVIVEHHAQEELELFPAVLKSAVRGDELEQVQSIVERLTAEHRRAEALWSRIKPALKQIAKGHDADLDQTSVAQMVDNYQAHAAYEEGTFLPLSQTILGRNANHMAALGLSLHMRHARPVIGYI